MGWAPRWARCQRCTPWGHLTNDERARETGELATEAMFDVPPMQYAIRGGVGRPRALSVELSDSPGGSRGAPFADMRLNSKKTRFQEFSPT